MLLFLIEEDIFWTFLYACAKHFENLTSTEKNSRAGDTCKGRVELRGSIASLGKWGDQVLYVDVGLVGKEHMSKNEKLGQKKLGISRDIRSSLIYVIGGV